MFSHTPKTLDEMVVDPEKKKTLQKIIDDLPNCIFHGPPGTGKGCAMSLIERETEANILKLNASMENTLDDIRGKINDFATAYDTRKKIVYLNEAERLRAEDGQKALLQLIEDTHEITRYFLVVNNINKIIPALRSRCSTILDFSSPPGDKIFSRCVSILKQEGVKIENKNSIISVIKKLYPDIRQIIGTLQSNTYNGVLKSDIKFSVMEDLYKDILSKFLDADIEATRRILKSNYIDYDDLYKFLYTEVMENPNLVSSPGDAIVYIGEAMYRESSVVISEINFMWMFFSMLKKDII